MPGGRGPAPKDPKRRARTNAEPIPIRIIHADPVQQPELPDFDVEVNEGGEITTAAFKWHPRTREWWRMWAESPLSAEFTQSDWDFLLDTAMLHTRYWMGQMAAASELRLRVAKFGATPEDRARLRIVFASAEDADDRRESKKRASSARQRRGPLTGT